MSHRTQDLPPLHGFPYILRELRYHETSRQFLAILLIIFFTSIAQPTLFLFLASVPLMLAGTMLRLFASGYIVKNMELATTGPYALVRHPLYSGNILIILGFSISSGNFWSVPIALLFFFFYYPAAIEYEDRKLYKLFGPLWKSWSERVPALIPKLTKIKLSSSGRWSFIKSLKNNGEPVITLFILYCLILISRKLY